MSFGIYKPNQGYWVRVMTAIFAGVLVLSGAVWAWSQAAAAPLPTPTWQLQLNRVQGNLSAGDTLRFVEQSTGEAQVFASGVVESFETTDAGRATAIVGQITIDDSELNLTNAIRVRTGDAGAVDQVADFSASIETRGVSGIPAFERTYLQGGAAGVVILVGSVLIFWLVANRKKSVEFLIATDGEMKKVNWSTKREVYGSTVVVIVATFLIAAILFAIDYGFSQFFTAVGVLQR